MSTNDQHDPLHRRHVRIFAGVWLVLVVLWLLPEPAAWSAPHRGWETALVSGVVDKRREVEVRAAPFAPRSSWEGTATGDLSYLFDLPHLDMPRAQTFHTDEYGFRNPPGTSASNRDVVVVGNSFAVGSSVRDEETLSGRLRALGVAATDSGGFGLQAFLQDPRWQQPPPKWVVHYVDEASLLPPLLREDLPALDLPAFETREEYEAWIRREVATLDRTEEGVGSDDLPSWLRWLPSNDAQQRLKADLAARQTLIAGVFAYLVPRAAHALGLPTFFDAALLHVDEPSGQVFYRPSAARYLDPAQLQQALQSVDLLAETFRAAAQLLEARGTRLIVLVCPNKELVYRDLIPALADVDTGAVLTRLDERLTALGVPHVDAWAVCRRARQEQPDAPLFFGDDTHPTPRLQDLLAQQVAEIVAGR